MVVLLVLLTVVLVLTAEWILGRRHNGSRERAASRVRLVPSPAADPAAGNRYMHPGHSWARVSGDQPAVVGADEFALHLLGPLDGVELPEPGTVVAQGAPLFTLRRGGRRLVQPAPVSGVVIGVNRDLKTAPGLLNESPYENGWVATLAPANLATELGNLFRGRLAERWEESVRMQLVEWFSPRMGTVLQDGGELVNGVGDLLSDEEWERVVKDFFPAYGPSETAPRG